MGRKSYRAGPVETPRPDMLVIGIIGGMAACAPAGIAGTAPVPAAGNAAAAGVIAGAAPVQADGTDKAPTDTALPRPADTADPAPPPRPVKPVKLTVPVLTPVAAAVVAASSPLATSPITAPVVAARAVLLPPVMNIRMSVLIGIIAIRAGMLSELSEFSDDSDDDDEDDAVDPLADVARSCSADGVAVSSCGPADMMVSESVPAEAPTAWVAAAAWFARPPVGLVVCGGMV